MGNPPITRELTYCEEIALEQYSALITRARGNPSTHAILNLHNLLLQIPGITPEEQKTITDLAFAQLRRNQQGLLEDLATINQALESTEDPQEIVTGEQAIAQPEASQDSPVTDDDGRALTALSEAITLPTSPAPSRQEQEFIPLPKAKQRLSSKFPDPELVAAVCRMLRDETLRDDYIRSFIENFQGYIPLDLDEAGKLLGTSSRENLIRTLSSYLGSEIQDMIRRIRPVMRYHLYFYMLKESTPLESLLDPLQRIQKSREEGNLSYRDVSFILNKRRVAPGIPFFDLIIETEFSMLPEGTYERDSAERFKEKTKDYRYLMMRSFMGRNQISITNVLQALESYSGDLVLKIDLTQAPSWGPGERKYVYFFRCNEQEYVDFSELSKALGIPLR